MALPVGLKCLGMQNQCCVFFLTLKGLERVEEFSVHKILCPFEINQLYKYILILEEQDMLHCIIHNIVVTGSHMLLK